MITNKHLKLRFWIGSAIDAVAGIGSMYLQEDITKRAEERQEERTIDAEQRANAEYDRRMADERAYNDPSAQAQRLRSAGINPMANLGQGVTSSSTKMSAPTQSTSPLGSTPSAPNGLSSLGTQFLQNQQLKSQTIGQGLENKKKYEEGRALWIQNCITEFENGNIPDSSNDGVEKVSKIPQYNIVPVIDDNGEIVDLKTEPIDKDENLYEDFQSVGNFIKELQPVRFNDAVYGPFTIFRDSYANQERAIDLLNQKADLGLKNDKLGQAWAQLLMQAVGVVSGVKGANASSLVAMAKWLESEYLYGTDMTWKWAVDKVLQAVGVATGAYSNVKGGAKKAVKKAVTKE